MLNIIKGQMELSKSAVNGIIRLFNSTCLNPESPYLDARGFAGQQSHFGWSYPNKRERFKERYRISLVQPKIILGF